MSGTPSSGASLGRVRVSRWALGVVVAITALIALVVVRAHHAIPPQEASMDMSDMPLGPFAHEVTLATADRDASFHVYRPHVGITTDDQVVRVWLTPGQVAIRYQSGVTAYVSHAQVHDPRTFFETQIADGLEGSIVNVAGGIALLVPGLGTAVGDYGGAFDLFLDGIEVQVIGPRGGNLSSDHLRQMAQSVA